MEIFSNYSHYSWNITHFQQNTATKNCNFQRLQSILAAISQKKFIVNIVFGNFYIEIKSDIDYIDYKVIVLKKSYDIIR